MTPARKQAAYLAPVALLGALLGAVGLLRSTGSGTPQPAREAAALPWPYCAPDAVQPAPSPTPWPTLPPSGPTANIFHTTVYPMADAIVDVSAVDLDEDDGDIARVEFSEIIWQTAFPERDENDTPILPLRGESTAVVGTGSTWREISRVLAEGGEIVLGLGHSSSEEGAYSLAFAFQNDPDEPTFIGESPFAERDTGQFRTFIDWSGNPGWEEDPLALVLAWNVEADAPGPQYPSMGPITLSFERFWHEATGTAHPTPGSLEWWTSAPAHCRSILDAPARVLEGLPFGTVWVHVPDSWRDLTDAVICLRVESLGSEGCGDQFGTTADWPYLYWDEVYTNPGEPILVEVAKLKGQAPSWVERVAIGRIPYETFAGGTVLVELDPSAAPASFDAATQGLAQARFLPAAEDRALLDGVPPATEEPDTDP